MIRVILINCAMLLLTFTLTVKLNAQNIYFNFSNGTNTSYNLSDVRKLTYDEDVLNLHLWDGTIYSWNVSTVGNYQFDENSLQIEDFLNLANIWEVTIYPNPANSFFNVAFFLPQEDNITIELFDTQGNLIHTEKTGNVSSGRHTISVEINGLPNGIYLCKLTGQKQMVTKKIIKE